VRTTTTDPRKKLHTREKIIDWLPRLLLHSDKQTPKLILMREDCSGITTSNEILNIFGMFISTKLLTNRKHNKIAEPSDDLVVFTIPIFKAIIEAIVGFIFRTDGRFDIIGNITP
jgi:hypothetical protein